jgi:CheY-like chemotaxis protein
MRLEFSLLVVDDAPGNVDGAIGELSDHLEAKGFVLRKTIAPDLSEKALRELARSSGKDYNLVMVDFNLGRTDMNGAVAAAKIRRELQFTDMLFYSSAPLAELRAELAKQEVAGVFVANRQTIGESLIGLADTVIGKAVDLSHMRGIAMAEVSDMDVQMEEILEKVFSVKDDRFEAVAKRTLTRLTEGVEEHRDDIAALVKKGKIIEVVTDPRLFPSMQKYRAVMRAADCLNEKPAGALNVLRSYVADVIGNRNTLAHAKEDQSADGVSSLRAISKGKPSIPIDDVWMSNFRNSLRMQRTALTAVCDALGRHVEMLTRAQEGNQSKT